MKSIYRRLLTALLLSGLFACTPIKSDREDLKKSPDLLTVLLEKKQTQKFKREGPHNFFRYHHRIRTRDGDAGPRYRTNYKAIELQKSLTKVQSIRLREDLDWVERGPGNVGGRTRGIWVDPRDTTHLTWLAGSVGGGIWRTNDGGNSWTIVSEELSNMATSTLAGSANNPLVVYAGTGEGFDQFMIIGNGIWKSVDGGDNWSVLSSTADNEDFANVTRIIVDPQNENNVLVSTRVNFRQNQEEDEERVVSHIFRSTDGGATWQSTYSGVSDNLRSNRGVVQQLVADPQDFNTIYASVNRTAILKSIDQGRTWDEVFDVRNREIRRMELAIAPAHPNIIYIAAETIDDPQLLHSGDGGQNWNLVDGDYGDWFAGQGWYDNTIAVHPFDTNTVFVGGAGPILSITKGSDLSRVNAYVGNFENNADFFELDLAFLGGISPTEDFLSGVFGNTNLADELPAEQVSVEIRFGPDVMQMAHWHANLDRDSYRDFVEVPFEVWDVTNDRQLAVSFYDSNGNGEWDLLDFTDDFTEFLSVHAIDYSTEPDEAVMEGSMYENSYYLILGGNNSGEDIDLENLPSTELIVNTEVVSILESEFEPVVDGYDEYSTDELETFTKGVHVDHHNLVLIPTDEETGAFLMINANDGGIAFSTDGGETFLQTGDTFREEITLDEDTFVYNTTKGYNTSQFYGVDKMNGADRYIGGTQDNGSFVSPSNADEASDWALAPSGDGFEAAWHYQNPDLLLESSQFNFIYKSTDGGRAWSALDLPGFGPFYTRIANSKQEPNLVFAVGSRGVLRSQDFGDNWEVIQVPDEWVYDDSPIEISVASPEVVWSGGVHSDTERIIYSTNGGSSFRSTAAYAEAKMGPVTGIATHPFDPETAFALFSMADGPKILKTTDLGAHWEDLSGFVTNQDESNNGFPDVATYSLVVMPFDTNQIWVGTEIGLFESLDGGASWQNANNGLPPVAIFEMKIVNDQVVLATHGRGVWSVSLPQLEGYEPPIAVPFPQIASTGNGFNGKIEGVYQLTAPYDSTLLMVEVALSETEIVQQRLPIGPNEFELAELFDFSVDIDSDSILIGAASIIAFKDDLTLTSTVDVPILDVDDVPVLEYENDFDQGQMDFARLNFNIFTAEGFDNNALHSPHPYDGNTDNILTVFQKPIQVTAGSVFSFDEIALVEPGFTEEFGSEDFFDYVTIEGTVDSGKTWQTIEGYDSRLHFDWEIAYYDDVMPTPELIRPHEIMLTDHFDEGTVVYLRFKLVSDPFEEGWGWLIDNVRLASMTTNVDQRVNAFLQINTYPNPMKEKGVLEYRLPESGMITAELFTLDGKRVQAIVNAVEPAGFHVKRVDVDELPTGVYLLRFEFGRERKVVKWLKL